MEREDKLSQIVRDQMIISYSDEEDIISLPGSI